MLDSSKRSNRKRNGKGIKVRSTEDELLSCQDLVQLSQHVVQRLRDRPELNNVLPLSLEGMTHFYELSLKLQKSHPENKNNSKIIAEIVNHISLDSSAKILRSEKEKLALMHIGLFVQGALSSSMQSASTSSSSTASSVSSRELGRDLWSEALSMVFKNPYIRISRKQSFSAFCRDRNLWKKAMKAAGDHEMYSSEDGGKEPAKTSEWSLEFAVRAAPTWWEALQLCNVFPENVNLKMSFINRADVKKLVNDKPRSLTEEERSMCIAKLVLHFYAQVPANLKTFNSATTMMSTAVKKVFGANDSEYIQMSTDILQGPVRHYLKNNDLSSGTVSSTAEERTSWRSAKLQNRVQWMVRYQQWREAISLCCALDLYDVALPIGKYYSASTKQSLSDVSLVLNSFETKLSDLKENRACASLPKDVAFAEIAAHLLNGNFDQVIRHPLCYESPTLTNLLGLLRLSELQKYDAVPDALFMMSFQNDDLTRSFFDNVSHLDRVEYFSSLVPPLQKQFLKILTSSQRRYLWEEGKESSVLEEEEQILSNVEDCLAWAENVLKKRALESQPIQSSEEALRAIADLASSGRLQLTHSSRYALGLTLLHYGSEDVYATQLKQRNSSDKRPLGFALDAASILRAYRSIPANHLKYDLHAQNTVLDKLLLSGYWEVALRKFEMLKGNGLLRHPGETYLSDREIPSNTGIYETGILLSTPKFEAARKKIVETMTKLVFLQNGKLSLPPPDRKRKSRPKKPWWFQFIRKLWFESRYMFPLCVYELLHDDIRETADQVHRIFALRASKTAVHLKDTEQEAIRLYVGAAFSLLNSEKKLSFIVHQLQKKRVEVEDMDSFSLQRILGALPVENGVEILQRVTEMQCYRKTVVEEDWVLQLLCRLELDPTDQELVEQLKRFTPHSLVVNAFAFVLNSVLDRNLKSALKGLLRSVEIINSYPLSSHLFHYFALLLKQFLLHSEEMVKACEREAQKPNVAPYNYEEDVRLAKMLFNRLVLNDLYTAKLKVCRRELFLTFDQKHAPMYYSSETVGENFSSVLIVGSAAIVVCRAEKVPIPARIVSLLLREAALEHYVPDWPAALFFFDQLRSPNLQEKKMVFTCLQRSEMLCKAASDEDDKDEGHRTSNIPSSSLAASEDGTTAAEEQRFLDSYGSVDQGAIMPVLLKQVNLFKGLPELVLLWTDENSLEKIKESIAFLDLRISSSSEKDAEDKIWEILEQRQYMESKNSAESQRALEIFTRLQYFHKNYPLNATSMTSKIVSKLRSKAPNFSR